MNSVVINVCIVRSKVSLRIGNSGDSCGGTGRDFTAEDFYVYGGASVLTTTSLVASASTGATNPRSSLLDWIKLSSSISLFGGRRLVWGSGGGGKIFLGRPRLVLAAGSALGEKPKTEPSKKPCPPANYPAAIGAGISDRVSINYGSGKSSTSGYIIVSLCGSSGRGGCASDLIKVSLSPFSM